jgi:hypothetical protein
MKLLSEIGIFEYLWKPGPETVRSAAIAVLAVVVQVVRDTDAATFASPQAWLWAVAVGVGTALLPLVLGKRPAAGA